MSSLPGLQENTITEIETQSVQAGAQQLAVLASSFELAQVCLCLVMQVDFPPASHASAAPSPVLCRQMLEFLPAAPTTGEIKLQATERQVKGG